MYLKKYIEKSNTIVGLYRDYKAIRSIPYLVKRHIDDNKLINNYFRSTNVRKLQIGAGLSYHQGWLGTDIYPTSDRIIYLDATKKFPFENDTFDFIYNEHMIEHIKYQDGLFMLKECWRILKPKGIIRIATPDLRVLAGLYTEDKSIKNEYIKWITDQFINSENDYKVGFTINNAFYNWGHQFLYDDDLMISILQKAKFVNLKKCFYGESEHETLKGIESHGENAKNKKMVIYETMIFEGEKKLE